MVDQVPKPGPQISVVEQVCIESSKGRQFQTHSHLSSEFFNSAITKSTQVLHINSMVTSHAHVSLFP